MNRQIRTFVLRNGKMSTAQKRSYNELYAAYCIEKNSKIVDTASLFKNNNPLIIEIGFGMGRATAKIAENNPDNNYLGIEVHKAGIGRLLWDIEKKELKNIRIAEDDAKEFIFNCIADNTVSGFHIFFPDPWPKKRHHKRRLITRPFTDLLKDKLQKNGYIYFVSDWENYCEWSLRELSNTPLLSNSYQVYAERQVWRPDTEFELKGLSKLHKVKELFFVKDA